MASEEGFDVSKRGWPDFILEREGKIIFVEVKPYAAHPLKADQERILRFLSSHGIPCFKWTPDGGYEEI